MSNNIRYNSFAISDWDRILYNAKMMNFAKNKKFLRKLVYSGKICTEQTIIPKYDIGQTGTNENKNRFREMYYRRLCDYIDTYQNKFGDDWDVHFQKNYEYSDTTYIIFFFKIFDKVVVKNYDKKTEHTINDLAVFNTIGMKDSGDFWIPKMKGVRLTFSRQEIISGYVHSHLRTRRDLMDRGCDFLDAFCTGSSSDTSLLSGLLSTEFSKEQFEIYLYSQDSTIECESAIGTPYIRFSNLLDQTNKVVNISVEDTYYSYIEEPLFSSVPIDVTYYISDNKYFIKNDDVFHSFIKKFILNTFSDSFWKTVICKKGERDTYYSYDSLEQKVDNTPLSIEKDSTTNTTPYIFYKGIKKEFKIARPHIKTKSKLKIEEFIVYPNLLNYIHEQLEHKLQQKAIAASNIRRHYSSNNASSYLR